MVEAKLDILERDRSLAANEVCANVRGQRMKRVNMKQIHKEAMGIRKAIRVDLEANKEVIAESRKRAREHKAKLEQRSKRKKGAE